MAFPFTLTLIPAGSPLTVAPVAVPPMANVIFAIGVLIHKVWFLLPGSDIVASPVTVMVPFLEPWAQVPVVFTV